MTEQNTGWRDISTAPKDGSTVILYWGGGQVCPGSFLDNSHPNPLMSWAGWRPPSGQTWPKGQPTDWQPLPPPPGAGDNIDTVEGIDALRADNAELKRLITHMVEAIGKGAVDSEEIVPVPGDGPPYRFHEEWVHYARSALSTKEGEQE